MATRVAVEVYLIEYYRSQSAIVEVFFFIRRLMAANLARIRRVEVVEYPELGMEAIWRIEVEDFPAFIIIDDKGNDFFKELNLG